jgi:hypothetical protein
MCYRKSSEGVLYGRQPTVEVLYRNHINNGRAMGKFYKPKELQLILEAKAESASPAEFSRKPQHKELKEMWCAVRFGLGYEKFVGPCSISVDLEENSDADFVVRTNVGEFPFQTRIADVPTRRMGDETTNQLLMEHSLRDPTSRREGVLKALRGLRQL